MTCRILGPKKNVLSIEYDDLESCIKTNYTTDHMTLVGASGVDHGGFVKAMKKAFGMLSVSPNPNPLRCKAHPKPDFIGLEVRVSDNDIPTTTFFTLHKWTRRSIAPTATEVEHAKSQLKAEALVMYLMTSAPMMVDLQSIVSGQQYRDIR